MSFFVDVPNEMKSLGALVKKLCGAGQADASQFQAKLAAQLAAKIFSINVTDSVDAWALYDTITESGLDEANTQSLVAAVDAKVLSTSEAARGTAANNTQLLLNSQSWMTLSLVSSLQDPRKSFDAELQLMKDFLSLWVHPPSRENFSVVVLRRSGFTLRKWHSQLSEHLRAVY